MGQRRAKQMETFMHKNLFLASFGAIVFTGSVAVAADLLPPQPPPPPLPPPFTWTGIYVGGQIGYAWAADDYNNFGFDPVSRLFVNSTIRNNPNGVIGGAHLGSQVQFNQLVLGIEGSVDGTSLNSTAVGTIPEVANVRIRKCESCQILARRRPQWNPIDATFHTVCKNYAHGVYSGIGAAASCLTQFSTA
jgi:opacity protein-like surface antigen